MRFGRWAASAWLIVLGACQAPAPATPTPAPPTPPTTSAPTPTTSAPTATTSARVAPTPVTAPPAAPPASATRVETLNAANAAFRSGDLKTAAGLYDRVANTPPAASEGTATMAIDDFAQFRAVVTLLADGREDDARAHLEMLRTRNASAPFARLGNQLWDQYGMTGQLRGACAQLQPQITSQAGSVLATLQGIGVSVDGPTLCSVP